MKLFIFFILNKSLSLSLNDVLLFSFASEISTILDFEFNPKNLSTLSPNCFLSDNSLSLINISLVNKIFPLFTLLFFFLFFYNYF